MGRGTTGNGSGWTQYFGPLPGMFQRLVDNFGAQVYRLPTPPRVGRLSPPISTWKPPGSPQPPALSSDEGAFPNIRLMHYQSPNKPQWEHFGFDLCRPSAPRDNGIGFSLPFICNKIRAWAIMAIPQSVAFTPNFSAKIHIELFNRDNPSDRIEMPISVNAVNLPFAYLPRSRTLSRSIPYTTWNGAAWVQRSFQYTWTTAPPMERSTPITDVPGMMHCAIRDTTGGQEMVYSVIPFCVDTEMFCNAGLFRLEAWATSDAPFEALPEYWAVGSVLFYCEDK